MILKKEMLNKPLKKLRVTAIDLLRKLSKAGGLPDPVFEHSAGGTPKRPTHFFQVRFRVPNFIKEDLVASGAIDCVNAVTGSGKCGTKANAKSLAALEAVLRLEDALDMDQGSLQKRMDDFIDEQKRKNDELLAVPITQEIPGVSWENIPVDPSFSETMPAGRLGTIDFFSSMVKESPDAFMAAKAMTLTCQEMLPAVGIHSDHTADDEILRYANIRALGHIEGVVGPLPNELSYGVDSRKAVLQGLQRIAINLRKRRKKDHVLGAIVAACDRPDSSFGMAKLFVKLPTHQFQGLKLLLAKAQYYSSPISSTRNESAQQQRQRDRDTFERLLASSTRPPKSGQGERALNARLASFRAHQKKYPLPVDSVETRIPHDAMVTIVRGGTGSGKTTRYPLMLSLFSPSGETTKIIVAQPRRLACQTAARRVAYEQGFQVGSHQCPIGYAIRFESFLASADSGRTIDFMTPGVLLRRAAEDPLLSDLTHLCIDEIHERNADMDLLLALAKQALRRRANHKTLPPLQLILMSATLDSSHWESYFRKDYPETSVAVVDVPDGRRFPITTVHLGQKGFPLEQSVVQQLLQQRTNGGDCDEALCMATGALAIRLFSSKNDLEGGSILCFLPGMEEIRRVHRYIDDHSLRWSVPNVIYLHSSVSSGDQAKAFEPGPKIILSTNIAETSLTIPDVKIVIDSGRERQLSLLDSTSESDSVTVVGSQLATVNISRASAQQRAGRAGRVSAGTCYRLYSQIEMETQFEEFATPEMLRMELSQLVLHSISLYHPTSGHPLSLLLGAPDPPTESRLRQTLRALSFQGLVDVSDDDGFTNFSTPEEGGVEQPVSLTPLGQAVSNLPVSPRIGRMIFLGLVLRAIDPALTIAALLSVPKVFVSSSRLVNNRGEKVCSDVVLQMEAYQKYLEIDERRRAIHPKAIVFNQVTRIRGQLERAMTTYLNQHSKTNASKSDEDTNWNANSNRVAAQVGLICGATPHIAHLVSGKYEFATRDVAGNAQIHPSSVNFGNEKRAHWYVYHELRVTKEAYLNVTTAASPLDLALFSDASSSLDANASDGGEGLYEGLEDLCGDDDWLFTADQWVPVVVSLPAQRMAFEKLRRLLSYDMLQQVAQDPTRFSSDPAYEQIVLFVLSALEHQRLSK